MFILAPELSLVLLPADEKDWDGLGDRLRLFFFLCAVLGGCCAIFTSGKLGSGQGKSFPTERMTKDVCY